MGPDRIDLLQLAKQSMSRIGEVFSELRATGARAFMPFVVAGDPDLAATARVIETLDAAGCHLCEVGFPFSDPVADGPVIQAAFTRALQKRTRVEDVLGMIRAVAPRVRMPLVGMVSATLVFRRGIDIFVREAAEAGLAGLIVPDLPLEEAGGVADACRARGVDLAPLVTPTTSSERAAKICARASGFVYCVAVAGVTGERTGLSAGIEGRLRELRTLTSLPLCVGFGVSGPEQAIALREVADGVIVGSAVVRQVEAMSGEPAADAARLEAFGKWSREFVQALQPQKMAG